MKGNRNFALQYATLFVTIALLSGCGRTTTSNPNLETWVAEIKAKPGLPIEPVPPMVQFETFLYNDQGLRDPFAAPVDTRSASGPRPNPDRRKQVLEAYPLDSLVMVGTLGAGSNLVGLVMSPDRVTHRITVAPETYLGQSDGRATSVEPTKIDITELVPDGAGGWIERPASIALPNQ